MRVANAGGVEGCTYQVLHTGNGERYDGFLVHSLYPFDITS